MASHTYNDLKQYQALPLSIKVSMTQRRIRDWVNYYGLSGVYVSFSGGKDSTVLLTIARDMYPGIKAVFSDTSLEFPEIKTFVNTWDNVDIVKPKMNFKNVCEEYGFPLISKEVSQSVFEVRTALKNGRPAPAHLMKKFNGVYKMSVTGIPSRYNIPQHKYLLSAPFAISHMCCKVVKKRPINQYAKETGRVPITALMASESMLRTAMWLRNGCNSFDSKHPISKPMSFWTEQDVLQFVKNNKIKIASVYGDIVTDYEADGQLPGQMFIGDYMTESEKEAVSLHGPKLKTTGCQRTGCMLCGFGCHLEKGENRFERLKRTHPKVYKALDVIQNNGVTYRQAIDWINENNGKGKIIRY